MTPSRASWSLFAVLAGAAPGLAVTPDPAGPCFQARPGAMELTGRLLAHTHAAAPLLDDPAPQAAALLQAYQATPMPELSEYVVTVPPGEDESSLAAKLLASGLFDWVRPDWLLYPAGAGQLVPDDPLLDSQWHIQRIHAPQAWAINTGLPTMTVAIVDTGVGSQSSDGITGVHADIGNLVTGVCAHITHRTTGITYDSNGHGTMVAGVAGATGNNSLGVCGIGWNIAIMPVRVTNPDFAGGGASFSDIQWGALWASSHGARIVSVSFDGVAEPGVEALGATLRSRGVLLVWPMDNTGTNYGTSFDHPHVTVVSGTDEQDNLYASSSYGQGVDLAAPAVNIMTTALGDSYGAGTGNSFAAPIVSAGAACVWGMAPWLAPDQVERILIDSAEDIGPPGDDQFFGAGRIDLHAALWLTVIRAFCTGNTAESYDPGAFSIDDLYDFANRPIDVTGDGVIDNRDTGCISAFLRSTEPKDMFGGRP